MYEFNRYNQRKYKSAFHNIETEAGEVTLRIMRNFNRSVEKTGARFIVLNMPGKQDLQDIENDLPLTYNDVIDRKSVV